MSPIVAASSGAIRQQLVELASGTSPVIHQVTDDPKGLENLLQQDPGAWVLTGGTLALARPFLAASRAANAAVVAVVSDRIRPQTRSDLDYGGLAVLRAIPSSQTLGAALAGSRAGLNIWDPSLRDTPEVAAVPSVVTPLSPREREVLELTGLGRPTKAIARQLGISPNTVKFHLHSAFEKLGVTSRAEAVLAAIRRGELAI